MNLFKKSDDEEIGVFSPPNHGFLQKRLSDKEMDFLWRCIDNRKGSHKSKLAGQIHESNVLVDKSDWFYLNTIKPLMKKYYESFIRSPAYHIPTNQYHPCYLHSFWVNYQKQNEFNPLHDHSGIFSFIIWMKIPTKHEEQNKNPLASGSNSKKISVVEFLYSNILGEHETYGFEMNPVLEGTMLFFPSKLRHCVYPFYNCDEDRISVSGNIKLNTAKLL